MLDERVIEWSELWKQEGVEKGRLDGTPQPGKVVRYDPAKPAIAPLSHMITMSGGADADSLIQTGGTLITMSGDDGADASDELLATAFERATRSGSGNSRSKTGSIRSPNTSCATAGMAA